jgi:hypothetical protein
MKISTKSILIIIAILNISILFALCMCNSCVDLNVFCLKCLDSKDVIQLLLLALTTLGFVITITTFIKANQIKSAEFYLNFKERFKSNETFNSIRANIYMLSEIKEKPQDDDKLATIEKLQKTIKDIDKVKRIDYAGFFEEIQVLITKKLVTKKDIYFSFGQYILECDESKEFWEGLDKNHPLWKNFNLLVTEIRRLERKNKK